MLSAVSHGVPARHHHTCRRLRRGSTQVEPLPELSTADHWTRVLLSGHQRFHSLLCSRFKQIRISIVYMNSYSLWQIYFLKLLFFFSLLEVIYNF